MNFQGSTAFLWMHTITSSDHNYHFSVFSCYVYMHLSEYIVYRIYFNSKNVGNSLTMRNSMNNHSTSFWGLSSTFKWFNITVCLPHHSKSLHYKPIVKIYWNCNLLTFSNQQNYNRYLLNCSFKVKKNNKELWNLNTFLMFL